MLEEIQIESEKYLNDSKEESNDWIQMVDEVIDGNFICPILHLSKEEEARIRKPWRRCLIIKLLGRSLGFRFLEKKLL